MKCSFCGREVIKGTGKIVVKKEGTMHYFCSNKCEKNLLKLKRNPLKTKWTKEFRKQKELSKNEKKKREVPKAKKKKKR